MTTPSRILARAQDGFTDVKIQLRHPMETGQRKDAGGRLIAAHFIRQVAISCEGRLVLSAQCGTAVSKDPFLTFRFQGGAKGEQLTVSWFDSNGESREDQARIV
jgi:sulfur-oxidizing protein SoxZ